MPKHLRACAVAGLIFVAGAGRLLAAAPAGGLYSVDVWGTPEGLPQSSVIALTQTRDGYLWLGTLNGLVRFDGVRFTVFDEGNTPGLNSSRIVHLFEDSQGRLWIGTETAGIALLKDGEVTSLGLGRGAREGRLAAACEDATGAVWLYAADGRLWRYANGRPTEFRAGGEEFSYCRAVIAEQGGPLWVGMDRRLTAVRPDATFTGPDLPVELRLPAGKLDALLASQRGGYWRLGDGRVTRWRTNRLEQDLGGYRWDTLRVSVTTACEDREGNLFVGTLGAGLFRFAADGKVTAITAREGLSHNSVLSLVVDREGTIWVGTDGGGLNRLKRQVFDVLSEARGMVVQSVCEDDRGGLWIGSNGGEVALWQEGTLRRFGPAEGLMNFSVKALLSEADQGVWVGTWARFGPGLFQWQSDRFERVPDAPPVVQAIHRDRQGRLWLGTRSGLARRDGVAWRMFTTRDGLSADVVRAIADDAEGNLWIGTEGGGLNRLRDGQFTAFRRGDGLPSEDVSSLWVDSDGVLWIGTGGSGLVRFHRGQWTRYTTREGLISNSVGYLIEDDQGFLWIGSNAGLMRVPKKALNDSARGALAAVPCRAYVEPDGLPTRECTTGSQPGTWRARDGRLWFPTVKGLVSVNPSLLTPNPIPPPVVIEAVIVDDQPRNNPLRVGWPQAVTLSPDQERLEIRFTSLNLSAPDRARFRYRLEGHESGWVEADNTRVARYSKLPPGEYRFRVTACNEDGVWNESGSTLALLVLPPFWRTWWFLTATAVCLLGAIVGLVHYFSTQKLQRQVEKLRQQEALEHERARIARDLHDQLGASLTQVSLLGELVESDKHLPQEIEAHARQITLTARDTTRVLDEIVWAVNPSNDTLDGLITYACKYAQDFLAVAGVRYRLDAPAQLPATPIPPDVRHNLFLAFKEAVTNVVRHARASEARVRLRLEPRRFTLEVADNGCGLAGDAAQSGRNGLRNMRKRMEEIGGEFSVGPAPDGGTLVRLTAPLKNR
jgi:ligand-binding sensor domain-containing protein/signal transduction histidine kinase